MHSPSKTERLWFSHLLESKSLPSPEDTPLLVIGQEKKRRIHELLARSEVFDNFLQLKFPNLKRVNIFLLRPPTICIDLTKIQYGLEGGESMLPALDSLFSSASQGMFNNSLTSYELSSTYDVIAGIQNIILGMSSFCIEPLSLTLTTAFPQQCHIVDV